MIEVKRRVFENCQYLGVDFSCKEQQVLPCVVGASIVQTIFNGVARTIGIRYFDHVLSLHGKDDVGDMVPYTLCIKKCSNGFSSNGIVLTVKLVTSLVDILSPAWSGLCINLSNPIGFSFSRIPMTRLGMISLSAYKRCYLPQHKRESLLSESEWHVKNYFRELQANM